jgi:hypothetical protein
MAGPWIDLPYLFFAEIWALLCGIAIGAFFIYDFAGQGKLDGYVFLGIGVVLGLFLLICLAIDLFAIMEVRRFARLLETIQQSRRSSDVNG